MSFSTTTKKRELDTNAEDAFASNAVALFDVYVFVMFGIAFSFLPHLPAATSHLSLVLILLFPLGYAGKQSGSTAEDMRRFASGVAPRRVRHGKGQAKPHLLARFVYLSIQLSLQLSLF